MGYFSWQCAVSSESIFNRDSDRGPTPCVVVCPDNTVIREDSYDGYGRFDGRDIFVELAKWNGLKPKKDRDLGSLGIDLDCQQHENGVMPRFPIKIVAAARYTGQKYEDLKPSEWCPRQGFFVGRSALE